VTPYFIVYGMEAVLLINSNILTHGDNGKPNSIIEMGQGPLWGIGMLDERRLHGLHNV